MQKKDLRIVFMGTPEFAVGTLSRLVEHDYNVVAVVTQPDKPVGRHQTELQPSAVKQYALTHHIPVLQPVKMKDPDFVEELAGYKADIQVVVAFRMLPEVVWAMPRMGTFNVHAALLPQYRGAAPINWAIINGETETGVTTFFLDHNIDTGRIIAQKRMPIPDDADVEYVYDHLMELGAEIATETLDRVLEGNGEVESIEQENMESATGMLHGAPKIFKETCRINWNQSAKQVYDFVRGLSPYPASWTTLQTNGMEQMLKIYQTQKTGEPCSDAHPGDIRCDRHHIYVACTDCWLELIQLQPAGKKRMTAQDFLNGNHHLELARLV
jgi:methionyl-tRNA formyltransferase